jgi:hypothetical protein
MIRRSTWFILVILLVLVGVSYYVKDRKAKQATLATPTVGQVALFPSTEGTPADIRIESAAGPSVEISRNEAGKWVLKAPEQADADQASAEAAATQLGALRVVSTVDLGLDVVGLDKPAYTITVTYSSATQHRLLVGSVTPIQNGYYVQLDGGKSQVVERAGLDALLGLVSKPPYLETPTPVASITPTLVPPTESTAATGTPSPMSPVATPTSTP